MTGSAINFTSKISKLPELWSPRVIAEMNEYQFKLVKVQGEFVWHKHDDTDEAFIVLSGELEIGLREGNVLIGTGEMYVVQKGIEHITRAARECHVLLVEPRGVMNTGDAGGPMTAQSDVWV